MRPLIALLVAAVLIEGCGMDQAHPTATPAPPRPDTALPISTATLSPTVAIPSPTPIPCFEEPFKGVPDTYDIPDLKAMRWETPQLSPDEAANSVRQIAHLPYPIFGIDPSPDGRWLLVRWAVGYRYQLTLTLAAILDTQGNHHRWITTQHYGRFGFFDWLPDSRLLWLDENGAVFIGGVDSARDLHAPEPINTINYLNEGIALASGKYREDCSCAYLWRVNVNSGQWEQVTRPAVLEPQSLGWFAGLSRDGSYALLYGYSSVAKLPIRMGAPVERKPDVFIQQPPGTDAEVQLQVVNVQLADSPYWLFRTWFSGGFALVNIDDGSRFDPVSVRLPSAEQYSYDASPDGRWVAIWLPGQSRISWVYIAPSSDLGAGVILETLTGMSGFGWIPGADEVLITQQEANSLSLVHLPLVANTVSIPLPGAGSLIGITPDAIFTTNPFGVSQVLVFAPNGSRLGPLTIDTHGYSIKFDQLTGTHGRAYLGATLFQAQPGGECVYDHMLIAWGVKNLQKPGE